MFCALDPQRRSKRPEPAGNTDFLQITAQLNLPAMLKKPKTPISSGYFNTKTLGIMCVRQPNSEHAPENGRLLVTEYHWSEPPEQYPGIGEDPRACGRGDKASGSGSVRSGFRHPVRIRS